jgi:outer membrane protein, heavy metal efflux system
MNRFMRVAALAACMTASLGLAAADAWPPRAAPPDLPANDVAKKLLDAHPRVQQAAHALRAARERARSLETGSHEWTARASTQRRNYRATGQEVSEWSAGVERAIRIGGKAAIDRELGEAQLRVAQARLGEARHEAARELLDLWLNWRAAVQARQLWAEQLGFAQSNLEAAGKRHKAGDASRLEENAARADLAEVQRQASGAAADEAKARAKLQARFGLPGPDPLSAALAEPIAPEGSASAWRERILGESDELRIAREEARRAELTAARARADRLPDPTIGVHVASEAGRAERVLGISFSMPIGGTYRSAQAGEAAAQALAAQSGAEQVQREIESEIAEALADATGSLERWRAAEDARAAAQESAQLTQRAYTLGEADLQSLLLARRQRVDAVLGSTQARVDALRARYRLLVDAHLIWELQDE